MNDYFFSVLLLFIFLVSVSLSEKDDFWGKIKQLKKNRTTVFLVV